MGKNYDFFKLHTNFVCIPSVATDNFHKICFYVNKK